MFKTWLSKGYLHVYLLNWFNNEQQPMFAVKVFKMVRYIVNYQQVYHKVMLTIERAAEWARGPVALT